MKSLSLSTTLTSNTALLNIILVSSFFLESIILITEKRAEYIVEAESVRQKLLFEQKKKVWRMR